MKAKNKKKMKQSQASIEKRKKLLTGVTPPPKVRNIQRIIGKYVQKSDAALKFFAEDTSVSESIRGQAITKITTVRNDLQKQREILARQIRTNHYQSVMDQLESMRDQLSKKTQVYAKFSKESSFSLDDEGLIALKLAKTSRTRKKKLF